MMPESTTPKESKHIFFAKFGDIKGAVTEPGYEGWTPVLSSQWGAGLSIARPGEPALGPDGEPDETQFPRRNASSLSASEITMKKISGSDSGQLLFNMLTKTVMDVTIVVLTKRAVPGSTTPALIRTTSYKLNHVIISHCSRSGETDEKSTTSCISESLSLNYGGFEIVSYDRDGEPLDAIHYHLHTGTTTYKAWNTEKKEFEVVITEKKQPTNEVSLY